MEYHVETPLQGQDRPWPDPHWELPLIYLQATRSNTSGQSAREHTRPLVPVGRFWITVTVPATHNPPSQPLFTLTFCSGEVPVPKSLNISQVEKTTKTMGAEKMLKLFLFIVTRLGGNIPFSVNMLTLTLIKMHNGAGNKVLYEYLFQKCSNDEAKRAGTGDHSRPHV